MQKLNASLKTAFKKKEKTPGAGAGGEEEWEEYWVGEDGEEVPVVSATNDDDVVNPPPEESRDPTPVAVYSTEGVAVEEEEKEEAPKKGLFGFTRPPPKPEKPALKPMSWRKIEKNGEAGEEREERPGERKRDGKVMKAFSFDPNPNTNLFLT